MMIREATLMEVLDNREKRVRRQQELLGEFSQTLICLTMNIPGPVKYSDLIAASYGLGKQKLLDLLRSSGMRLLHQEEVCAVTGCEGFFVVAAPAQQVKALTVGLEDSSEFGRLLDIDVLTAEGEKLSRTAGRKCLICGKPASVCGPVRAHSAAELWRKTEEILHSALTEDRSRRIGVLAAKALLYEVCITPKPGLVDRANRGAHRDMDIFTFMASTAALQNYFTDCAKAGLQTRKSAPEATFQKIRPLGMLAEQEMLRQTGGVNTHKGAVFSVGLACAAAGRLGGELPLAPETLFSHCAAMTRGLTEVDFKNVTPETARTAGEKFYAQYGITGIRGQAEAGFPAVKDWGLPTLREGLALGYDMDRAGAAALLAILAHTDDTNLITRSDRETQLEIAEMSKELLERDPYPKTEILQDMDRRFIQKNLSPGGSADLLAMTVFTHFLSQTNQEVIL
jgi:holo-ACP synthase/triphosphoribosyl-dephospho-CoA synthase